MTNDFDLIALNKQNGKIVWNTAIPRGDDYDEKNGVFASGPILADNRLIVTSSNGYIFSVSPYTAESLSYVSADEGIELPPVMAAGTTLFTTNDADIVAYK